VLSGIEPFAFIGKKGVTLFGILKDGTLHSPNAASIIMVRRVLNRFIRTIITNEPLESV